MYAPLRLVFNSTKVVLELIHGVYDNTVVTDNSTNTYFWNVIGDFTNFRPMKGGENWVTTIEVNQNYREGMEIVTIAVTDDNRKFHEIILEDIFTFQSH